MQQSSQDIDSRQLRATGKLKGYRPLEPLKPGELEIVLPNIKITPRSPVDAIIIMGLGPVDPILISSNGKRKVNISKSRMKHNTLAALELAASGYINKKGLIIPSGTATADPEEVNAALNFRTNFFNALKSKKQENITKKSQIRSALKAPASEEEADLVFKTTEAELMFDYFNRAHTKSGMNARKIGIEIFVENQATETIDNFIYSLNELDRRARNSNKSLFTGSIIFVTSSYHIARSYEIAKLFGVSESIVPLISEKILRFFNYSEKDKLFDKESKEYDKNTRWDEQKWIRMLQQHPRYLLPKLIEIEDDERLIKILKNLENIYGAEAMKRYNLSDIRQDKIKYFRSILSSFQRTNPVEEEWLKTDTEAIDEAIEVHKKFTYEWLSKYKPKQPAFDLSGFIEDLKIKF